MELPIPQSTGEIEVVQSVPRERAQQRTAEHMVESPVSYEGRKEKKVTQR